MADTKGAVAPDPATQRDSALRSPHSGGAGGARDDQAFSGKGDPKTPHSTLTESNEEGGRPLRFLDWFKQHDLVPPNFATEPMPSLVEVREHIRTSADEATDSDWGRAIRRGWGFVVGYPLTLIGYLLAWSSWFASRFAYVAIVVMTVVTALSWIPLVHWALYWLTFPYWWHRITGW